MNTTKRTIVVEPSKGWRSLGLADLWLYREMAYHIIKRDLVSRYIQTYGGFIWIALQPIFTMVLYSIVFGLLIRVPSDGVPYPAFYFSGFVAWLLFSSIVTTVANSLVNNSNLFTKVYFPRLIIPISNVAIPIVDFLIFLVILVVLLLIYGILPSYKILLMPVFALIAIMGGLGLGCIFASFSVFYRDAGIILNNVMLALTFATPIFYPVSLIPERFLIIYRLNPMVTVLEGFRWVFVNGQAPAIAPVILAAFIALALLISGMMIVKRTERTFADVV